MTPQFRQIATNNRQLNIFHIIQAVFVTEPPGDKHIVYNGALPNV